MKKISKEDFMNLDFIANGCDNFIFDSYDKELGMLVYRSNDFDDKYFVINFKPEDINEDVIGNIVYLEDIREFAFIVMNDDESEIEVYEVYDD